MTGRTLKAGDIIVAHPNLDADPTYGRAVMLIVKHGDTGTLAVNIAGEEIMDGKILKSGPIEGKALLYLSKVDPDETRGQVILGDTGYAARGIFPDADGMKLLDEKPADSLILMGYVGLKKGAAERQVQDGIWHVSDAKLEDLIATPREQRWAIASSGVNFDPPKEEPKPAPPKKKKGKSFDI